MTSTNNQESSAVDEHLSAFQSPEVSQEVQNLIEILSQGKRVFLLGAGISKCAGLPLMGDLTEQVKKKVDDDENVKTVLNHIENQYDGSGISNIEDYLSDIVDNISILERRYLKNSNSISLDIGDSSYDHERLTYVLNVLKGNIKEIISKDDVDLSIHRRFISNVHNRLLMGKDTVSSFTDYFTLNYDTLLEDSLSLEQIPYSDGFKGGISGWWDPNEFEEKNINARLFKVHGSIDWVLLDDDSYPKRVRPKLNIKENKQSVLIWPASTKYREAQRDPHAQMIDYFRKSLKFTHNIPVTLTIIGYSFGDAHINYEIDRSIRESGGNLTVNIFTHNDKPEGKVEEWYNDTEINEQIRIYSNKGFYHANHVIHQENDLPWWKFEDLTELLGGVK